MIPQERPLQHDRAGDRPTALGPHRKAVTLVGAHAIYMQLGEADLRVAPYTTGGDLVIDPATLGEVPPLEQAFMQAGFLPWVRAAA